MLGVNGRQVGSAILGLGGAGLTGLGIYFLAQLLLPQQEEVLFAFLVPVVITLGILLLATAGAAWTGSAAGRWGGITLAGLLGLGALSFMADALRLFPAGLPAGAGVNERAKAATALAMNGNAPPPVDVAQTGLWLLVVAACLAVVLLLGLAWSPRRSPLRRADRGEPDRPGP